MAETAAVQRKESSPAKTTESGEQTAFEKMDRVFADISRRAFEIFEGNGRTFGRDIENWFKAERELLHPVNIELTETDSAYEMKAEVPGFSEKEVEITVEPRRVVVSGKRESSSEDKKKGKVVSSEISSEQLLRIVDLPGPVDTGKTTAVLLKHGILSITLPKLAAAQSVQIKPAAS
jgi:HSP20 family protein